MIKQPQQQQPGGLVQEAIADLSSAALPPLNNLPQWARVNNLDKARYPKPFLKDRLQPLPNTQLDRRRDSMDSDDRELDDGEANPQIRIQHLEKSLNFLQLQHREVLDNLHDEIDVLKRENKELQFKIVMVQRNTPPGSSKKDRKSAKSQRAPSGSATTVVEEEQYSHGSDDKMEELKLIFLEEELKEVKKALRDEKNKSQYLQKLMDSQQKHQNSAASRSSKRERKDSQSAKTNTSLTMEGGAIGGGGGKEEVAVENTDAQTTETEEAEVKSLPLPFNATLEPLLVHLPNQPPRQPTLTECHIILKHMQKVNDKQAHELNALKTDLRDVLYSHKWTPDAYLLAKAYIAADDEKEGAAAASAPHYPAGTHASSDHPHSRLPKIPMRHPTRKFPTDSNSMKYVRTDVVTLPALKQTMGNRAIERRKRIDVLHKVKHK